MTPRSSRQGAPLAIDDLRPGYYIRSRADRLSELSRSDFVLWPKSDVRALGSSRVRVSVMGWCTIGFPIALDGGALYLEIILGRRAPKWDVRHIDSIVLTF